MLTLIFLFLAILIVCAAWLAIGVAAIHYAPKLLEDGRGERFQRWLESAPGLDVAIFWCTAVPMLLGMVIAHSATGSLLAAAAGFITGWLAMMLCVNAWSLWHEKQRADDMTDSRIVSLINARTGRLRNHAALWVTATVVPVFWIVRLAEIAAYPLLTALVKLPAQDQSKWVNVSRHKFEGLVGHDLIWCLYCDWMTGVWSLGTEMLRNVESFWCPIRFSNPEKCAVCSKEFPDVENEWVPSDGTMADVTGLLDRKLAGGNHAWFGHSSRLTINGEPAPVSTSTASSSAPAPAEPPEAPPTTPASPEARQEAGPAKHAGDPVTDQPMGAHEASQQDDAGGASHASEQADAEPSESERELDAAADDLLRLEDDEHRDKPSS